MSLSARDITQIERAYPDGLSSREIIEELGARGEHLSEASLRRYVQLGLLPRSRRVGEKGKHRGSRGIYPVEVIRRVDEIRRALTSGETLDAMTRGAQTMRAKLATVRVALDEVLDEGRRDLGASRFERGERTRLRGELDGLERQVKELLKGLADWSLAVDAAKARKAGRVTGGSPKSGSRGGI